MKSVGIDIDGVLADFTSAFRDILRNNLEVDMPADYQPTDWNWLSAGLPKGAMNKAWNIIDNTKDFWLQLKPLQPNVAELREFFELEAGKNFDIYFITARKDGRAGRSVKTQSEEWLTYQLNYPVHEVTVLPTNSGMDKVDVLHALDIDFSIDDHMPTIVNAKSAFKKHKAYLLDQPWNQDGKFYNVNVVKSLSEFFTIIRNS